MSMMTIFAFNALSRLIEVDISIVSITKNNESCIKHVCCLTSFTLGVTLIITRSLLSYLNSNNDCVHDNNNDDSRFFNEKLVFNYNELK